MNCHEFRVQIFTYMDGEVTITEHREITRHLDGCPPCTEVLAYEVRIREVVATRCCETAPDDLRARLMIALEQVGGDEAGSR